MNSADELNFEIIFPIEEHAKLIMEWRNDPESLSMSFNQEKKVWETFWKSFLTSYFSIPELPPVFIKLGNQKVGYLTFRNVSLASSKIRKSCEISIHLIKEKRGQGIGKKTLEKIKVWIKNQGIHDIYAYIKKENRASLKAFSAAGYINEGPVSELEEEMLRFHAPLTNLSIFEKEVFIIAEAGSNWRLGHEKNDLAFSKRLIEIAAESGANAIKFQVFQPESLYVKNAGKSEYLAKAGINQEIVSILSDLKMPYERIPELKKYCDQCNISFMATPFSKEDFYAIDPYVSIHKIASYEISHLRLIELAAKSQKPLLLSTGASDEKEIAWAVDYFYEKKGKELVLLQCTAKYPALANEMNLKAIQTLREHFRVWSGLSDHGKAPVLSPVAAVALGARVIEKHFTVSRDLPGPDHSFALLPHELKSMVHSIREVEEMLGSGIKQVLLAEKELEAFAKRGVQAIQEIQVGDQFQEGINIEILRPGHQKKGMHPKYIEEINGKTSTRHIYYGEGITKNDGI